MTPDALEMIARLGLAPLPWEGGFFRQTWRDAAGSAIYFLLTPENFSALHRLRTTEIWHFYAGDPVEHVQLNAAGVIRTRFGADPRVNDAQLVVPAGVWQAARTAGAHVSSSSKSAEAHDARGVPLARQNGWSLLGCTLAPPWDERGFELGERAALLREFPAEAEIIHALTR